MDMTSWLDGVCYNILHSSFLMTEELKRYVQVEVLNINQTPTRDARLKL